MVLVTATPHSGKEENFRSLLALLDPAFLDLPVDLSGDENRRHRERLARHLVQRRRGDLEDYLDTHTPFPEREIAEESYQLHPEYRKILDRILEFTRERVLDPELDEHRQRVRWWSALALLRSLASSPPAAASTLRNRSAPADTETPEEADEVGRRTVLDQDEEALDGVDVAPGGQTDEDAESRDRRRLLEFAREVEKLDGRQGPKAGEGDEADRRVPQGRLLAHRLLPVHPHRPLRHGVPPGALRRQGGGRGGHGGAGAGGARAPGPGAGEPARPQAGAGLHGLPERGDQPPGLVRCGHALRPSLEPHAPRAAGGARRPVRPAGGRGAHAHVLRRRQPRGRDRPPGAAPEAPDDPQVAGDHRAGPDGHEHGGRSDLRGAPAPRERRRYPALLRLPEGGAGEGRRAVGRGRRAGEAEPHAVRPEEHPRRRGRAGAGGDAPRAGRQRGGEAVRPDRAAGPRRRRIRERHCPRRPLGRRPAGSGTPRGWKARPTSPSRTRRHGTPSA